MSKTEDKREYRVIGTAFESPGVTTLQVESVGEATRYIPGQFITVYFPELGTPEGKAYSISSAPHEVLSLVIKDMGEFSHRLSQLKAGDTIFGSEPSGYFFSESTTNPLVMLAAGIGIAPFRSMILDSIKKNPSRLLKLFYSNRTIADIIFKKTFDELASQNHSLEIRHFVTRQSDLPQEINVGRIRADEVARSIGENEESDVLICGSISFVRDYWRSLKSLEIREDKIYTEAFFSH